MADAPFVAVDTEFMRETTYWPKLCLVQVASAEEGAVIDPLAEGIDLAPLLGLMANERVEKVFHAARQDVEIFDYLGVLPRPLFDTQIAAMAAGFGEQVAYDALVRQMLKIGLDKSSRFTDWARRPLSQAQLDYALADVTHLAALYPLLRDRLAAEGRLAWVTEEMTNLIDPANYDIDPEKAWRRLKPRRFTTKYLAVLRGVAAWRERTAQTRDQPRGRLLKDDAIDEIATQLPTDTGGLDRLRSLPKGFASSRFGAEIVEAVRAALANPDAYAPIIERKATPANPASGADRRVAQGAAQGPLGRRRRGVQADRNGRRPQTDRGRRCSRCRGPARLAAGGLRRRCAQAQARRACAGAGRRPRARGRGAPGAAAGPRLTAPVPSS